MGYVTKTLLPGERIAVTGKLHRWIYVRPAVFVLIGLIFSQAGIVGAAFLIAGALDFLRAWIERLSTELAVTDKRVIAKTGLIRRSTIELGHRKVESIQVDQSILGRVVGFGTIIVRGSGGTDTPIPRIADPLKFRSIALQTIEAQP